ncbi:MAG: 6-bladed beta-propeller [Bacteroidota bacterium]
MEIRIIRLIIYLSFHFIFVTCSSVEESASQQTISINVDSIREYQMHEIFSNINLIPLETTEESTISEIKKLIFHEGKYYVLDYRAKAIFRFDASGRFLSKFQKIGKGPGEYLGIDDFIINPYSGNLEILQVDGIVIVYTLEGEFVKRFSIGSEVRSTQFFHIVSEDIIAFLSEYTENRLWLYSRSKNQVIKKLHEVPLFVGSDTPFKSINSPFYKHSKVMNFSEPHTRRVYTISLNGYSLKYAWDFGNDFDISMFPQGQTIEENVEFWQKSTKDYVSYFRYNLENDELIITFFAYNESYNLLLYKKESKTYRIVKNFKEGAVPDLIDFINEDKGVYSCVMAEDLHHFINEDVLSEKDKALWHRIDDLENPVIVQYYFND